MGMSKLRFLVICILFGWGGLSFACDPCALYSAMNAKEGKPGSIYLSVFEQMTSFEKGDENAYASLRNGERIKRYSTTQLNLSYGVIENMSLQVSVPFIIRSFDEVKNYRSSSETDAGIGDVSIIAQYAKRFSLGNEFNLSSSLYAGLKLPTGDTGSIGELATTDSSVEADKHHPITGIAGAGRVLTFGSGSFDFPIGGSINLSKDRFLLPMGIQYTIRTKGSYDYQFDNDLFWYVNPGYFVLLEDGYSLSVNAFLSGENKGADEIDGQRVSLSSFSNLFFGPSIGLSIGESFSGDIAYQMRVTDKDNGIIVPEDRLRLAVGWKF